MVQQKILYFLWPGEGTALTRRRGSSPRAPLFHWLFYMDQKIGYRGFQAVANSHIVQCEHHLVAGLFVCGKSVNSARKRNNPIYCQPLKIKSRAAYFSFFYPCFFPSFMLYLFIYIYILYENSRKGAVGNWNRINSASPARIASISTSSIRCFSNALTMSAII